MVMSMPQAKQMLHPNLVLVCIAVFLGLLLAWAQSQICKALCRSNGGARDKAKKSDDHRGDTSDCQDSSKASSCP